MANHGEEEDDTSNNALWSTFGVVNILKSNNNADDCINLIDDESDGDSKSTIRSKEIMNNNFCVGVSKNQNLDTPKTILRQIW